MLTGCRASACWAYPFQCPFDLQVADEATFEWEDEGRAKTSAKKLIRTLAVEHGADSVEFAEVAPLVAQSVNAGEVLIRLSELGHDPKSQVIAINLVELADIEKSDALKNYKGKRNGINALLKLIVDGEQKEMWKKKGSEKLLHNLLKEQPWLIRPEYSRYLTSDENLHRVSTAIANHLGVDNSAPLDDAKRPDLVFVMSDSGAPHQINVVELKSPSIPLTNTHLTQLEGYIAKIERYCKMELQRDVQVHGYLIGAMPDTKSTVEDETLLINRMGKTGPETQWKVVGLRSLLVSAQSAHASAIEALESDIRRGLANDEETPALPAAIHGAVPALAAPVDERLHAIASTANHAEAVAAHSFDDTDSATENAGAPEVIASAHFRAGGP